MLRHRAVGLCAVNVDMGAPLSQFTSDSQRLFEGQARSRPPLEDVFPWQHCHDSRCVREHVQWSKMSIGSHGMVSLGQVRCVCFCCYLLVFIFPSISSCCEIRTCMYM